jgi:hypothetical protein
MKSKFSIIVILLSLTCRSSYTQDSTAATIEYLPFIVTEKGDTMLCSTMEDIYIFPK